MAGMQSYSHEDFFLVCQHTIAKSVFKYILDKCLEKT